MWELRGSEGERAEVAAVGLQVRVMRSGPGWAALAGPDPWRQWVQLPMGPFDRVVTLRCLKILSSLALAKDGFSSGVCILMVLARRTRQSLRLSVASSGEAGCGLLWICCRTWQGSRPWPDPGEAGPL